MEMVKDSTGGIEREGGGGRETQTKDKEKGRKTERESGREMQTHRAIYTDTDTDR